MFLEQNAMRSLEQHTKQALPPQSEAPGKQATQYQKPLSLRCNLYSLSLGRTLVSTLKEIC